MKFRITWSEPDNEEVEELTLDETLTKYKWLASVGIHEGPFESIKLTTSYPATCLVERLKDE